MDPITQGRAVEGRQGGDIVSGRPWFSVCCVGCLLLIAAIGIGGFILLRVMVGPSSTQLTALPENYPKDLPLFHMEAVNSINQMKGTQKSKIIQLISGPAKLFTFVTPKAASTSGDAHSTSTMADVQNAIGTYSLDFQNEDTLTITWKHLKATRLDVVRYYENLFVKAGLQEKAVRDELTSTDLIFASRSDEAMQIQLQDLPETPEIDELVITVDYTAK